MTCGECQSVLSQYEKGELDPTEAAGVSQHVDSCLVCAKRLEALLNLDALLRGLPSPGPDASGLLSVTEHVHGNVTGGEILDVEQVASYLKLSPEEVLRFLDDLPCFVVAGQVRFRRSALMQWIHEREKEHRRDAMVERFVTDSVATDRPFVQRMRLNGG